MTTTTITTMTTITSIIVVVIAVVIVVIVVVVIGVVMVVVVVAGGDGANSAGYWSSWLSKARSVLWIAARVSVKCGAESTGLWGGGDEFWFESGTWSELSGAGDLPRRRYGGKCGVSCGLAVRAHFQLRIRHGAAADVV